MNEQQVWFSLSHSIKKVRREESMHTGLWTCIRLHLVITAIADKRLLDVRTAYPIRCLTRPAGTRQYIAVFHLKTLIHCLLKYFLRSSTPRVLFKKSCSTTPENRNLDIVVAFLYKCWKILDAQGGFVYDASIY
jgi:hypothetical protein